MMDRSDIPHVSVIVPVFNDTERLRLCLGALQQQTYHSYKVTVVDNGSDDLSSVIRLVHNYRCASLLVEEKPGSYAARNRGISESDGAILAFTDSDCIPHPDWILTGVRRLSEHRRCGLLAGRIDLFFRDTARLSAVEIYEKINGFDQKTKVEQYHYGATANVFTLRTVLEDVGLFDCKLKSGGDVEWGKRVFTRGYVQVYANDVCVQHPARHSYGEIYRKAVRVEGGLRERDGVKTTAANNYGFFSFVRDLLKLAKYSLGLGYRMMLNRHPFRELDGLNQKLQYSAVFMFVRIVKMIERIRLRMGGAPVR